MAQAKKKQATKTVKKQACSKKASNCKKKQVCKINNSERNHIYIITAMGIITALLLCANVVIMMS